MWYHLTYNGQLSSVWNYSKNLFYLDLLDILHKLCLLGLHYRRWTWIGKGLCLPFHRAWRVGNFKLCFTLLSKDGTPGAKDLQWKRVNDRGKIWPTYDARAGMFFFSSLLLSSNYCFLTQGGLPEEVVCHWGGLRWSDGSGEFFSFFSSWF